MRQPARAGRDRPFAGSVVSRCTDVPHVPSTAGQSGSAEDTAPPDNSPQSPGLQGMGIPGWRRGWSPSGEWLRWLPALGSTGQPDGGSVLASSGPIR